MNLPMAPVQAASEELTSAEIAALQDEVRALAAERDAVILAHNYQLPEIQDVADYVGDSLGLSPPGGGRRRRTSSPSAACTSWPRRPRSCRPTRRVLIPDLDAGCSLADSITPDQLRAWQAKHPGAMTVMYVNTTAEIKALTDYCVTSSNAVKVVEHILDEHGERTPRSSSAPTCSSAPTSSKELGLAARCTSGTASATSTPASARPTSPRCAPSTRAPTS